MTDYTKLEPGDFHQAVGMDAQKWTEAFFQHFPEAVGVLDYDTTLGWFANAIMAGFDAANGGGPLNGDHAQYLIDKGLT